MRRPLYLAALSVLTLLSFAPAAFAQQGDLSCGDFRSQREAQGVYLQDPSDPNNLDADGDGIACEELLPPGSTISALPPLVATPPEAPAPQPPPTQAALPNTGGPAVGSVLLPTTALLLGSGLLELAILLRGNR